MRRQARLLLITALLTVGACSPTAPSPSAALALSDCHLAGGCDAVLAAARQVASLDGARVVVLQGRGLGFHAEVHVCYANGSYVLVDVMGDDMKAAVRQHSWDNPPCR